MKTLDEVIKALEELGDFVAECNYCSAEYCNESYEFDKCFAGDALHYLREYQKEKTILKDSKEHWEYWSTRYYNEIEKAEENDPLTWDELRTMEGKPVWVELPKSNRKAWGLSDGIYADAFGHDIITIKVLHDLWHLDKAQIGKSWQAYRKERG